MLKHAFSPLAAAALLAVGAALPACQEKGKDGKVLDTPTSGSIVVAVDESFRPILESHIDTFQKLYTGAKIRAIYGPEGDVIQQFLASDSVRDVVLARPLTAAEEDEFKKQQLVPVTTKIAVDAVAIIVNPTNPDTALSFGQLQNVFSGRATKWQQIDPETKMTDDITVVFDHSASGTRRFVRDSVLAGAPLTDKAFATKSHQELIDYVATHPGAMGVLGVNWISDGDDKQVKGFLHKVRVVGVAAKRGRTETQQYMKPYQAYIALRSVPGEAGYPLCRNLYIINREGRNGLGTGFASFVAGDKGQRIFLKSGLVPAMAVRREVQIRTE